jgi:hypothetical protein
VSGTETHFLSLPQYNPESSFTCATGATLAWAGDDPKNDKTAFSSTVEHKTQNIYLLGLKQCSTTFIYVDPGALL